MRACGDEIDIGLHGVARRGEDAFAAGQAEGVIFAARENCGVLDGNAALVVVAIERPGLQLAAREFSLMHQQMKWMLVVVALFADSMKAGDELGFGEWRPVRLGGSGGHKSNSIPS